MWPGAPSLGAGTSGPCGPGGSGSLGGGASGPVGVSGVSRAGVGSAGTVGVSGTTGWSGVTGVWGISKVGMGSGYPPRRAGSTDVGMRTLTDGFAELTLEARDIARMERFYTEALGLPVLAREPDRVWLAAGPKARLGLWTPGEKEHADRGGSHVHYAFGAAPDALDALAARLREHGAAVRGPLEHDGGDRSLYVKDPEGNVVEVWDFFARRRQVADLA